MQIRLSFQKRLENLYFLTFCHKNSEKYLFYGILQGLSVKKDLIEFLLQGRNFILFCLLCYKAVCLSTKANLVSRITDICLKECV